MGNLEQQALESPSRTHAPSEWYLNHSERNMDFQKRLSHLQPIRYPQKDFFVADIFDAAPKDDTASMEHPMFALKAGDKRVRTYERNGVSIKILPHPELGCATIHDKDIWIYCISQMMEAMNRSREDISRTVRFTAYDFLTVTNRRTDGDSYKRLADALERLKGTNIVTNIKPKGYRGKEMIGLLDHARIVEHGQGDKMVAIEVTLPDWLYKSIQSKQVLTLSREYFRLRKPLDRRIYELARKHCGKQSQWQVGLSTLHEKSGSTAILREFKRSIRDLVESNQLPDYLVVFDDGSDMVTFYPREKSYRPK